MDSRRPIAEAECRAFANFVRQYAPEGRLPLPTASDQPKATGSGNRELAPSIDAQDPHFGEASISGRKLAKLPFLCDFNGRSDLFGKLDGPDFDAEVA